MKAQTSNSDSTAFQSRLPAFALALAVCAIAIYAIVVGPESMRSLERFKAEQIQKEDRIHCEQFRMPIGSEGFAACAARLNEVRQRHAERVTGPL